MAKKKLKEELKDDQTPVKAAEDEEAESENEEDSAEEEETDADDGAEEQESDGNQEEAKATGEKARISAILNCKEAKGREKQAQVLALETDLSPETAAKILAASPVAERKADNPLAAAMKGQKQPNIGNDGGTAGENAENPLIAAQQKHRPASIKK